MKKVAVFLLTSVALQTIGAQSFIQAYKDRADMVTQTNINTNLQEFAGLGVKKRVQQLITMLLTGLKTNICLTDIQQATFLKTPSPMEVMPQKI
ncbi:hypothetical protein [Chryseobacterium sp. CH21]|uniref:hypothetical protein n=1 Tax=Chryseobacterium sp. CH21 TaxID=713556 RepID=UPI001E2E03E8|nr:hypothetical protein [Chryseobacterium sp. CH21]